MYRLSLSVDFRRSAVLAIAFFVSFVPNNASAPDRAAVLHEKTTVS
jgi:hypothetical protein